MEMKKIDGADIGSSYGMIQMFNDIAGRFTAPNKEETLDFLIGLVFEEFSEVVDAFEQRDATNFAKEVADLWVVTASLMQTMEASGFNMREVVRRVDWNNLSKFPEEMPRDVPADCARVEWNEKWSRCIIKREDGKVLKPVNYKKTDVSGLAPDGFFNKDAA